MKIKEVLSLFLIHILTFYMPILDLIRKNEVLVQYYGLSPQSYLFCLLMIWPIPLFSYLLLFKYSKKFELLFLIYCLLNILGNSTQFGLAGLLSACFITALFILGLKKKDQLVWTLSVLSIFFIYNSIFKSFSAFDDIFPAGFHRRQSYKNGIQDLVKNENAPKDIIVILLDGSDFSSRFLDEAGLPKKDILPNMHEALKDFAIFKNARTNAPQTHVSLPIMLTGILDYSHATLEFNKGRSILDIFSYHYEPKVFAYRNYYEAYCSSFNKACYPFKNERSKEQAISIVFKMYAYNHFFKTIKLPFELGKKFNPESTGYDINDVLDVINEEESQFIFAHIFKRQNKKGENELILFDNEFDSLVKKLKELGKYDTSMIAVISDHGMDYTLKGKPYGFDAKVQSDAIIRVPLYVKLPNNNKKGVYTKNVQNIDLQKTLIQNTFKKSIFDTDGQDIFSDNYKENLKQSYICDKKGTKTDIKVSDGKFYIGKCKSSKL